MLILPKQTHIWDATERDWKPGNVGDIAGNVTIPQFNGGIGATNLSFWRGDGIWAIPTAGEIGGIADPGSNGYVVRTGPGITISRTFQAPAAGFTISNPDGVSGNSIFALANDLFALESLSGAGFAKRTASDTWVLTNPTAIDVGLGDVLNETQLTTANNLADVDNAPVARANLGVAIGSNVQAWDADLDSIAAISETLGLLKKIAANTWVLDTNTYATQAYADSLVVGLLDDRGNYDASGNVFPSSGGSGSGGSIKKGDLWTISVAGILGSHPVTAGDVVRALVDTPGSTDANWAIGENNFGYVALNQALANGKIYIGNGSGVGTAVTPSGDITITNTGVTAIGALKVLNAMIANSTIDLTTKVSGILPSANGGTGIAFFQASGPTALRIYSFPDATATIARIDAGQTFTGTNNFGHVLPSITDTFDMGSSVKLWRKGWISELDTILFSQQTQTLIGGWLVLTKNEGTIPVGQDVGIADATIDFGQAMTVNDFVVFRSSLQVEYVQVSSLSSGTRYNVTRNLDGSGANAWPAGSVYRVDGNIGNGRIELNANATPRISLIKQGATYNAQTEIVRIGDLNGWSTDYSVETYGVVFGVSSGTWLKIDSTNGVRIGFSTTTLTQIDGSGNASFTGAITASSGAIGGFTIEATRLTGINSITGITQRLNSQSANIQWLNTSPSESIGTLGMTNAGGLTSISLDANLPTSNNAGQVISRLTALNNDATAGVSFTLESFGSANAKAGTSEAYLAVGSGSLSGFVIGAIGTPNAMLDVRGNAVITGIATLAGLVTKTSTGLAEFGIDESASAQLPISNNSVGTPFNNFNNFSGLIIINDPSQTGATAIFIGGGGNMALIRDSHFLFTDVKDTAGKVNVYGEGGVVKIQNKQGNTINFRVFAIRMRAAG